jgi:hypothetical protein
MLINSNLAAKIIYEQFKLIQLKRTIIFHVNVFIEAMQRLCDLSIIRMYRLTFISASKGMTALLLTKSIVVLFIAVAHVKYVALRLLFFISCRTPRRKFARWTMQRGTFRQLVCGSYGEGHPGRSHAGETR